MKNLFSVACLFALFFSVQSFSQSGKYGVSAGYNNFIGSVSLEGQPGNASNGASGYYIGFFGEFDLADKFTIRPELQFSQAFNNGESGELLILPVVFNYEIVDKLKLGAGPVFDYYLGEDDEDVTNFGLGLGFNGAYDISEKISITTMYSLGITNRTPDLQVSTGFQTFDVTSKFDFFQVGLSYKF